MVTMVTNGPFGGRLPFRLLFALIDYAYNRFMDEVAEVKSRLEIAEVVGQYLPLKQSGRNLKAP
jgi:hypothetical protein